jgi:hypothetical protein
MIRFPRMKSHITSFLPELNGRIALSVAGYSRRAQSWNCSPLGMRMARAMAAITVSVLITGFTVRAQQAAPPATAALTTLPTCRWQITNRAEERLERTRIAVVRPDPHPRFGRVSVSDGARGAPEDEPIRQRRRGAM